MGNPAGMIIDTDGEVSGVEKSSLIRNRTLLETIQLFPASMCSGVKFVTGFFECILLGFPVILPWWKYIPGLMR